MLDSFPTRPPTPQGRRRYRTIIGLLGLGVISVLILQYTPYHLLPVSKTDTIWGILVGMTAMTAFAEYRWSDSVVRDRTD